MCGRILMNVCLRELLRSVGTHGYAKAPGVLVVE